MKNITLQVPDTEYGLLIQLLRSLQYVKIKAVSTESAPRDSQLLQLQRVLQQQTKQLFQDISDPSAWQKQQRDEWS